MPINDMVATKARMIKNINTFFIFSPFFEIAVTNILQLVGDLFYIMSTPRYSKTNLICFHKIPPLKLNSVFFKSSPPF